MAETISDLSKSKHLNVIANILGLVASYEEVERVDTSIIEKTTKLVADGHKVPIPPHINSESIIHGAMDNLDHNDTHDSILMLFQNRCDDVSTERMMSK